LKSACRADAQQRLLRVNKSCHVCAKQK